jgi:neurotransmitter:Na+ symporter, NSS family
MASARASWSSRFGFLMSCIGSSVGLGNFWRFPYLAGENGGGAWVLIYLATCFVLILPLLVAEIVIGRRGGLSAIGSTVKVARDHGASPAWGVIGVMGVIAAFLILSFYSVIGGWVIDYVVESAGGAFTGATKDSVGAQFGALVSDPVKMTVFHAAFMAITVWIVAAGVKSGLEAFNTIVMPVLFFMLVAMVVYAAIEGDWARGMAFLFEPRFDKLTWDGVLAAVGQGFFSIGVGIGVFITFGSYLKGEGNLVPNAAIIAGSDTLVAILAGCVIFPIVFAQGLEPGSGPGLMFQTLPLAFAGLPGTLYVSTFFFVLIFFAAVTSSISLLEIVVARAEDTGGGNRVVLAVAVGFAAWVLGIGSVLSFNVWSEVRPADFGPFAGMNIFDFLDTLTGTYMLPIGGILIGLFTGWVIPRDVFARELGVSQGLATALWAFIAVISPAAITIMFVFKAGIL